MRDSQITWAYIDKERSTYGDVVTISSKLGALDMSHSFSVLEVVFDKSRNHSCFEKFLNDRGYYNINQLRERGSELNRIYELVEKFGDFKRKGNPECS